LALNVERCLHFRQLYIGDNKFNGSIPNEISALQAVDSLWLASLPHISGTLPSTIGHLTRLT
jgi:hypothetical protein